jgi:hypothetical protein
MIFGVDENRVVRTGSHAGFAANANRFIKIDDAVSALEHRGRWTRGHAGRVRALVAAGDLMRAAHLWEHTHVDVLDVGAGDANRDDVLRLAGCRARMTTDAASVVDHLRPLDAILANWFWLDHSGLHGR